MGRSSAFKAQQLERRLWLRAKMMSEGPEKFISGCALVGFDEGSLEIIIECLRGVMKDNESLVFTTDRFGSGCVSDQVDLIILFVDGYIDTISAVNDLICFRRFSPLARILITSREFKSDEMGGHRQVICDASLRWPIGKRRLASAIEFAFGEYGWYDV